MQKKKKILMLSDHALSTSGVGCQSRFLINGLVEKGTWTVRQLGAAIAHENYEPVKVNDDFFIKPVDGFGTPEMIRQILVTEKPDLIFIFTDPRFFMWLWEMEDEIHQVCPIAYWHVWDNYPAPQFNKVLYESTDLINCHSYLTYNILKEMYPDRTGFIPHALPESIFHELTEEQKALARNQVIGEKYQNSFIALWVNRNAKRKRPGDLIWAWSKFIKKLKDREGDKFKNDAYLFLHTDPTDPEGPNLYENIKMLDVVDSVVISPDRVDFNKMNLIHNAVDCCIQISYAEGFGLSTLESMQCGNPIIAVKTGGLTRQVVDHRDGSENGIALDVEFQTLVGSQHVPYIYEDYCDTETIANALLKMYDMDKDERNALGQKAKKYVQEEFGYQKTIDLWHQSLTKLVEDWEAQKGSRKQWSIQSF